MNTYTELQLENELFTQLTHVLEATVIQLIAKCFQSLWLVLKDIYIYMCIYIYKYKLTRVYIYIHTHIHVWKRCAIHSPKGGKKIKMHCDFSDFSVLFEIIKSDSG